MAFCFLYALSYAQSRYTDRIILKTELIHLITGQAGILVEKHFSKRSAVEFGGGFIFSDYTDRFFLPNFIDERQILLTEGYVLRTNYRRYKEIIKQNTQVSRYFQVDFFVKVIDYQPLKKQNCTIYSLKDVVGLSVNWGKPRITSRFWVYDLYAGIGIRVKYYASDICADNSGYTVAEAPKELTQIFSFFQTGVKFGRMLESKNSKKLVSGH